ncbi:hypothetical protein AB0395_32435 [Streptosporangium sp. NPDC051023]|uniref:hypothetical protein n=1 Tax=Streptosporangium sp. NPDC051023 TaxID=3155410 RepID=UPI00344E6D93
MITAKHRFALLAALPVLALSTACGSTAATASSKTPGPTAVAWHETAVKFATCMRKNGVDIPDPAVGQDIDASAITKSGQETWDAAMKACKEWDSVLLGGDGPSDPKDDEAYAKHAKCLQEGGVWQGATKDEEKPKDFKELPADTDAEREVIAKLLEKCSTLLPSRPFEK